MLEVKPTGLRGHTATMAKMSLRPKNYVVSISKTKPDRAMVTAKRE